MLIALVILTSFILLQVFVGYILSEPVYRGPVSDHFNGKKFFTPDGQKAKGFYEVLRWMVGRKQGPWKPAMAPEAGEKPPSKVADAARITFVNHSTFLIQTESLNILTDPVWSVRVSPFRWAGPKRMRPPGISLEDLPHIDVVFLSHNHYDHLDIDSLKAICARHRPRVITTLGIGAFLRKNGIENISELDWWQSLEVSSQLTAQAVPAQHFSGRGFFDRDGTLWCGFVLRRSAGNIYFAGDTGYNERLFKEIGSRCAPVQLGIIPIGAYKPEWFMSPIHCSPREAVTIHQDVGARLSIASHFGTFPLADDGQDEPAADLAAALQMAGLPESSFILLTEGYGRLF